jgi:hypothetical protein
VSLAIFNPQAIAHASLGEVDWLNDSIGYLSCPGVHLHTTQNGKRDCRIILFPGVPTITCFHTQCKPEVDRANHRLRSDMAKAERGKNPNAKPWKPSLADRKRTQQRELEEQRARSLQNRAADSLKGLLADQVDETEFRQSSPCRLEPDPKEHWRSLLSLYAPDCILWIGHTHDSAPEDASQWQKDRAAKHFRPVSEWLKQTRVPGNFTCPGTFKVGAFSRSNPNVISRPFLVVESDTLVRSQTLSLIKWLRNFLRLRAVVCTGGKSLHSWFDFPPEPILAELKIILPVLGADPALFKSSQPCRLPGAFRKDTGRNQSLIWFDSKGGRD